MNIHQLSEAVPGQEKTIPEFLTVLEVADLLKISKNAVHKKIKKDLFEIREIPFPGGKKIEIKFSSLPALVRKKYLGCLNPQDISNQITEKTDINFYSTLKKWEKDTVDYWLPILKAAEGLVVKELDEFLKIQREQCKNGKKRTGLSRGNFYKIKRKYELCGIKGIVPGFGKTEGITKIDEESYKFFEANYLREKGSSAENCWRAAKGEWIRTHAGEIPENFPTANTFLRVLKQRQTQSAIDYARKGEAWWERHYGTFSERIYNGIKPGQVWVGDHMQCNTAVMSILPKSIREDVEKLVKYDKTNRPVFPWITVWRCFSTGRWMGWNQHVAAPNSDHIFMAFADGVERNGNELPEEIYIDNGKDYRSKDFSSGKAKKRKLELDEKRVNSLMAILGIKVHFAIPYNPQTKPIERDFDIIQEWMDQGLPGYRGRSTSDRPESLAGQIKRGEILDIAEYAELVDYFIENILNEYQSKGKNLLGKSRNEAFALAYEPLKRVSDEALQMMYLRVSKKYVIGKNGVTVNQDYRIYYYAEWMFPLKGKEVYLRRNPKKYQLAYVYSYEGENVEGEYLGKAYLNIMDTAALAKTDLEKEQLRIVERSKKTERRFIKEQTKVPSIDPRRYIENIAASRAAERHDYPSIQRGNVTMKTSYDEMIQKENEMKKTGTYGFDINKLSKQKNGTKIFTFLTDKEEYEKQNKKGDDSDSPSIE